MKYSPFAFIVIAFFVCVGNTLSAEAPQEMSYKNRILENIMETLTSLSATAKNFSDAAKSIQDGSVYQKPETIDHVRDAFERRYRSLIRLESDFERLEDADAMELRLPVLTEWLSFSKVLNESFDRDLDFSDLPYINLAPNGPYPSGIDPKHIVEPDIRKDYEERIAKNTQLAREWNIQSPLRYLLEETPKEVEKIVRVTYARESRADQELIELLEKYDCPEEERHKLLALLDTPYVGFQAWQGIDGLVWPPPVELGPFLARPGESLEDFRKRWVEEWGPLPEGHELHLDGSLSNTTITTIEIPRSQLWVEREVEPLPEPTGRWKVVVAVNVVVIAIIAFLWWLLRKR